MSYLRNKRNAKFRKTLLLASVVTGFGASMMASSAGAEEGDDSNVAFEEIIVTAQKREQRLVEVPVSLTTMSGDTLANSSSFGLEDVVGMVPNVLFINLDTTSSALISIRGFGSDTTNPGLESGAAVYQDGIYLGRSAAFNTAMFDLERVEVLRGPQGTVFGRNSILGAFNIISNKPTDELGGKVDASIGNYGLKQTRGVINVPVSDQFAVRVAGVYRDTDGYLHNTVTGESINDRKSWGGRLSALLNASDDLEVLFTLDGSWDRSNGAVTDITGSPDDYDSLSDRELGAAEGIDDRNIWGTALTINYAMGEYNLVSLTSYRDTETLLTIDGDNMAVDLLTQAGNVDQNQFSQELRLDSPEGDALTWSLGLYYFTQDVATEQIFTFHPAATGAPIDLGVTSGFTEDTKAYAAFANTEYDVTEKLSVSLGLRFTHEKKTGLFMQDSMLAPLGLASIAPAAGEESWNNWSPSVVVSYAWTEDLNSYVKMVRGFKSGGFNGSLNTEVQDDGTLGSFRPEEITTYEVGFKGVFLENQLMVNFSAFYLDYTDMQIFVQDGTTGLGRIENLQNANDGGANIRSYGFEIDMTARPADGLELVATLGYTQLENVAAEDELANQPHWTGSLSAQYVTPISDTIDFMVRGDANYRSFFHSTRAHIFDNNATAIINARIGFEMADQGFGLYFWGRNLTDKEIFANVVPGDFFGNIKGNLEAPRTWGVEAKFSF